MKSNQNITCMARIFFAALISLLFFGCAKDVDPALRAKKAKLEKDIAKDVAYLEKTGINMAQRGGWMALDYLNHNVKGDDVENTAFDARNVYHTTQHLRGLQQELADVNKEIHRQEMIAPNLLVDAMIANPPHGHPPSSLMGGAAPTHTAAAITQTIPTVPSATHVEVK